MFGEQRGPLDVPDGVFRLLWVDAADAIRHWQHTTHAEVDDTRIVTILNSLHHRGLLSYETTGLTADEEAFLDQFSGTTNDPDTTAAVEVDSMIRHSRLDDAYVGLAEAAEILGISESRACHRLTERTLYAYPVSRAAQGIAAVAV